jgi:Carboxypeptidase regulatory-like domain
MLLSTRRVLSSRHIARMCAIVGAVSSCSYGDPLAPVIPHEVPAAQFAPLAFVADIDLSSGRMSITPPAASSAGGPTLSLGGLTPGVSLSLLGAEAIRLLPTNYHASEVGQFAPNKVRITFDITIENRLPRVSLTTPTWPQAPAPGVILFPLDYVTTTTPGGVTGGDSNAVIIELPAAGSVVPSVDWNGTGAAGSGSPYSFFNDIGCSAATSDECFRWSAYDLTIQPNSSSSTRTVGFDIDASVAQFRTRMIVAADLVPATIVSPARVSGRVVSPTAGPIAGARVTALTGEHAITDADGAYALNGLESGAVMLTVSNLPAGCEIPPTALLSIAAGDSALVDFPVTCNALTGMITGTLTSSDGGAPIAAATIVSSTGGSAVTSATGTFVISAAGSGTGTVTVSGLPAGCSFTAVPFVLQVGGALTLDLVASCPTPPGPPSQ